MIRVKDAQLKQKLKLYAAAAISKGEIVISNTGAKPATAALATQVVLGLALETALINTMIPVYPLSGTVMEIDFTNAGTKKTFTDADLGTDYDFVVTSHDFVLDPDDTTNGSLTLVGYDNANLKAYVMLKNTLILLG